LLPIPVVKDKGNGQDSLIRVAPRTNAFVPFSGRTHFLFNPCIVYERKGKMDTANHIPNNSDSQPIDGEIGNVYLQESYCSLNSDISTSAEEIFNQFQGDVKNSFPASYIP
jgi:hypothetical protein